VSPVAVVSWGSFGTVAGWIIWDWWVGQEEAAAALAEAHGEVEDGSSASSATSVSGTAPQHQGSRHSHDTSSTSPTSAPFSASSPVSSHPTGAPNLANYYTPYGSSASRFSPRNQQRLATAKSALLIYCALLGLSPILKSLTKSTTSDSIWAMSCWLMFINVFFFDYGGGPGVQ
jgi:phosphatidylinositol glycan class C protein